MLSLGGKPDEEKAEKRRNEDEFEDISNLLKAKMKQCKEKLKDRSELISSVGF